MYRPIILDNHRLQIGLFVPFCTFYFYFIVFFLNSTLFPLPRSTLLKQHEASHCYEQAVWL